MGSHSASTATSDASPPRTRSTFRRRRTNSCAPRVSLGAPNPAFLGPSFPFPSCVHSYFAPPPSRRYDSIA
ncbi:hypothetical protein B296_00007829 [Ensete ventricosum]|uniref:Uncharacterized protein n=1 Tax=Ensete ventricosum TaxID=4639 RepID=A0A427B378_ENSVE|nr:hypothetical protein B296_00007829 [Ensete ventricosum]